MGIIYYFLNNIFLKLFILIFFLFEIAYSQSSECITPEDDGLSILDNYIRYFDGDANTFKEMECITNPDEFLFVATTLPSSVRQSMITTKTWKNNCPIHLDKLAFIRMSYIGYDDQIHIGEMVVHQDIISDVKEIFERMYLSKFNINKMILIERYAGVDKISAADNNTSAFNCRPITNQRRYSKHSYGIAIDINPYDNPYFSLKNIYRNNLMSNYRIIPKNNKISYKDFLKFYCIRNPDKCNFIPEKAFINVVNRDNNSNKKGVLYENSSIVQVFEEINWDWGGLWPTSLRSITTDYQHIEKKEKKEKINSARNNTLDALFNRKKGKKKKKKINRRNRKLY